MKAPRLRAWHPELKIMEYPETIFTKENVHMLLNEEDYIWMRSTYQSDINAQEIYERDILRCKMGNEFQYFVVHYEARLARYINLSLHGKKFEGIEMDAADIFPEVIGNTYENPELMEDK